MSPLAPALEQAVAYVRSRYEPLGIVACGSIVRGEADPHSDYDLFVVHDQPWRMRDQQRFLGVPAEIFVNPPDAVRRYFAHEHAAARPSTAHMLATGVPIGNAAPLVHALVAEARDWLAKPPPPADLLALRYFAVDLLDDARDAHHNGDVAAELLLLAKTVDQIAAYAFRARDRYLPRRKATVRELAAIDPWAAALVTDFAAAPPPQRLAAVAKLAGHVLGEDTFFAWSSVPEPEPEP